MTDRIKRLKIEGFRGATQPLDLEFDPSKPVVLIFGENGTGKSTIVDAIETVGAGSTAFLDDWKLGKGKRKESFIPALGKNLGDVNISLEFGDNTYTATLGARGVQLCNTVDRPITKVLRRKSLQAFMDADPAQRYREVAAFLDIPRIEASEASLREALREAKSSYEKAVAANSQALESLQGLWEAEGSPGLEQKLNAIEWAKKQTAVSIDVLQTQLADLKSSVRHSESLAAQMATLIDTQQKEQLVKQQLEQATQALTALEAGENQSNSELVTLLQDAKIYLGKSPDTICPVCEVTPIDPSELVQRLQQRIDGMNEIKKAGETKQRAQQVVFSRREALTEAEDKLLDVSQAAQQHFYSELPEDQAIQHLRENDRDKAMAQASQLHSEFAAGLPQLQSGVESIQKQINNLAIIKPNVKSLDDKSVEAGQKESLSNRLQKAVDIVEEKRKSFVYSILLDIGEAIDELYQQIHPHEGIGKIHLKLDENQRGSLAYFVAFGGQHGIHPQPYYSESHLDTLGLCIFLALAKQAEATRTLVVLDDVLGSADQQHLKKTLTMLMEESANFAQLIITSHYRPLRDQFRFARQPAVPVQLIELKEWDFDQGIKSGMTLTYVEDLRQQLQQPDFRRESITAQAGILFESLLEFITRAYRCKVPHHAEPRFTFGELESAPNSKLKNALKIVTQDNGNTVEKMLAPIYESLKQAIQIRNLVGCHFNQWAGELSDQEVREMAELALTLADTLVCQHCGSLPLSSKSGSHWECSCKKTQMHPLQQPQ